ncbi:MAG: pyridoxamine 5'-phosphate oxidase family protein [Actinobacteria bacterium]|nr:pyridoxamine 5'-phosphate oxidase family protein [Actinomycetota bacterium]
MCPEASKPRFPARGEYGPPVGADPDERTIPWETVRRRLEEAEYYWLATTRRDGRPHVVPVGAVWLDDTLYFNTSPETVTAKLVAQNPHAAVHLESGQDAVIVEGILERADPDLVPPEAVKAYATKYGGSWDPADPNMPWFVLRPRLAMAWTGVDIRGTASRWRF